MQIKIRKYVESDVDPIFEAVRESHQELSKWMPWCHDNYARKDAEDWVHSRPDAWSQNEEWGYVIADENDRFLGTCGVHRIDQRNGIGEVGYWVRTTATGLGVATSATEAICDWSFAEMGLHRIEIIAAVTNRGSHRVAEKAGGVFEGTLRRRVFTGDAWHDAKLYSILKQDRNSELT